MSFRARHATMSKTASQAASTPPAYSLAGSLTLSQLAALHGTDSPLGCLPAVSARRTSDPEHIQDLQPRQRVDHFAAVVALLAQGVPSELEVPQVPHPRAYGQHLGQVREMVVGKVERDEVDEGGEGTRQGGEPGGNGGRKKSTALTEGSAEDDADE